MKIAVIAMAFVASAAFASSTTTGTTSAPATKEAAKKDAGHAAGHTATAPKDAKMAECKEKNADGTCKEAAKK